MWIIDRFEGEYAVIESGGTTFNIPKSVLPEKAKEGDCIDVCINTEETKHRKEKVNSLMNKLFRNK
ncbi:MAG: DUF3006 domain-containing protein [Clostridia bacterium]|nr:DUF3006 domain-containing protein [Clostridia bacterium]